MTETLPDPEAQMIPGETPVDEPQTADPQADERPDLTYDPLGNFAAVPERGSLLPPPPWPVKGYQRPAPRPIVPLSDPPFPLRSQGNPGILPEDAALLPAHVPPAEFRLVGESAAEARARLKRESEAAVVHGERIERTGILGRRTHVATAGGALAAGAELSSEPKTKGWIGRRLGRKHD
jgi:hypothetical protein